MKFVVLHVKQWTATLWTFTPTTSCVFTFLVVFTYMYVYVCRSNDLPTYSRKSFSCLPDTVFFSQIDLPNAVKNRPTVKTRDSPNQSVHIVL